MVPCLHPMEPPPWMLLASVTLFSFTDQSFIHILLKCSKAPGACVIATTGSDIQAGRLKEVDAKHVNNHDHDSNYGDTARSLLPNHLGVHHVIEIGEPTTLSQSFKAITMHNLARVVALLGEILSNQPNFAK
ncbi:hypothetical protein JMJ35_008741 [Cladonia borealis]|uniref:Uncharacterized protein n=1 Tax=Cladonia borealis TaxID=184061 RepID=A0AA39QSR2_9LECA|nr:hypothetical protein JMJ35_008741 [Cladonia borealis]